MIRWLLSFVAGVALATIPFVRYLHRAPHPHADHGPHHGGTLAMVADHHLELVRRRGEIHVFVTDSRRRFVRPCGGHIQAGHRAEQLHWRDHRLVAVDLGPDVDVVVTLCDGTRLAIGFVLAS